MKASLHEKGSFCNFEQKEWKTIRNENKLIAYVAKGISPFCGESHGLTLDRATRLVTWNAVALVSRRSLGLDCLETRNDFGFMDTELHKSEEIR
jgi:hypothetical protein